MLNRFVLVFAVILVCQSLFGADTPAVLITKVDPNQGQPKVGVVFDAAEVKLVVDEAGVPFSLTSSEGLPDYVVQALEQWRYSAFKKDRQSVPFEASLTVPIARPLTPFVERGLVPRWYPGAKEIMEAVKRGRELDETAAKKLEINLPEAEALGNPRTSLLVYYANQGAKDPEKARAARAGLLTWLVEHYPEDEILGSTFALVNSSGDALADADTSLALTKLWVDAVKQAPTDEKIRLHALNFLQAASPAEALNILAALPKWNQTSVWAGQVYGLAAIGASTLDPATGRVTAAVNSPKIAALGETAGRELLKSPDTKMVLVSLVNVTRAGRSLTSTSQVPSVFNEFCPKLLLHAKELYPGTTQSCNTNQSAGEEEQVTSISGQVTAANLIKKVQPVYPSEAKQKHVQGTMIFVAVINTAGAIENLTFKSGPFLLYPASRDAVAQWRYSPTRLDGKPVSVITTVTVNFTLGR